MSASSRPQGKGKREASPSPPADGETGKAGESALEDARRRKRQKLAAGYVFKVDDRGIEKRPQPRLKGKTVSSMPRMLAETEYEKLPGGLRGVVPYYFTYVANARKRWLGQTVAGLFETEFVGSSPEYIRKACAAGRLRIQDQIISPELVLRDNDWMTHEMHRHEPPVLDIEPEVLAETDAILAVNKPCSIPVHPCGRFRHNTVVFLLGRRSYLSLWPLYRLDRVTSGLLLFGKDQNAGRKYSEAIKARRVSKTYLARVDGEFPPGVLRVDARLDKLDGRTGQMGVVESGGKEASTIFERVSTADGSSVIRCKPLTGRTHQIRLHLLHLGFPISNDPLYNEAHRAALSARAEAEPESLARCGPVDPSSPNYDEICEMCNGQEVYKDISGHALELWLHALRYEFFPGEDLPPDNDLEQRVFTTPLPYWAEDDFDVNNHIVTTMRRKYSDAVAAVSTPADVAAQRAAAIDAAIVAGASGLEGAAGVAAKAVVGKDAATVVGDDAPPAAS
ncbi:uncharacterized protein AMSG_05245 [Thecamonas trahens ATCC 50062]|uniref:Pseudouridine synthase RsuA/RluA-like domain-containing protein n=1 Tax=Thecamonas trahens ATCC 50062 TaxID=461836 RepID=A0A0L0DAI7_THETB|nr:hypothetical protein AMSG_05245 [Thecamonas trahens ATCC 50062]KNC49250.1 hypothetical protein AMSG_05245 [Thecamonas trahens ATCC 50062]|eukprot:XP_013757964.1 hypothetical protein AMSG_05245 [Thecamonas trahens ATCC 50062]